MSDAPEVFQWEMIHTKRTEGGQHLTWTSRAKVIGGWVMRFATTDSDSLVFIPDPNHAWEVTAGEEVVTPKE